MIPDSGEYGICETAIWIIISKSLKIKVEMFEKEKFTIAQYRKYLMLIFKLKTLQYHPAINIGKNW